MRRIILLLTLVFVLSMLSGCSSNTADSLDKCVSEISSSFEENFGEQVNESWRMETIELYGSFRIEREPLTDVLYIVYNSMNRGGISVMLNPFTNSPLTYSDYILLYK